MGSHYIESIQPCDPGNDPGSSQDVNNRNGLDLFEAPGQNCQDFLLAVCISLPKGSFHFGGICAVGSVLGGVIGYGLGFWFMDLIGSRIIELYGLADKYEVVQGLYRQYDAWAVGVAGFTPLPYKVFTLTAGAFRIDFPTFVLVSLVSRSARFVLVAGLIYRYGAPIRGFIERYLNILTIILLVLLVMGFVLLKWLL